MRWNTVVPQLPAQLWLLAIAAFVNFLGFMVTPFLALYLTQVTSFSIEIAGLLLTVFGMGSILGAWTGGKLSDKLGSANVLVLSFVVSAVSMSIVPMLSGVLPIGAALAVLAFANGAFRPAYDASVVRLCPEDERPRAYAVYVVAINIGAGIAAATGGRFYSLEPSLIFYFDALSSLASAALVFFFLDRSTKHDRSGSPTKDSAKNPSVEPYKNISFMAVCLASCVLDVVAKQTSATLPIYVSFAYGMTPQAFGNLLTMGYITFAIAVMPVSSWVKTQNQVRTAIVGMGIIASAFAILPFASGVPMLVGLYLLMTFGQLLFYPAIMAVVMGEAATNAQKSGEYMGFYRTMQAAAGVAAPSIGTFVYSQASPNALWFLCAAFTLLSAFVVLGRRVKIASLPKREHADS